MHYSIKNVSLILGVDPQTIRYWEKEGLISPERMYGNKYRIYKDKDIEQLKLVKASREIGYSIKDCQATFSTKSSKDSKDNKDNKDNKDRILLLSKMTSDLLKVTEKHIEEFSVQLVKLKKTKRAIKRILDMDLSDEEKERLICEVIVEIGFPT